MDDVYFGEPTDSVLRAIFSDREAGGSKSRAKTYQTGIYGLLSKGPDPSRYVGPEVNLDKEPKTAVELAIALICERQQLFGAQPANNYPRTLFIGPTFGFECTAKQSRFSRPAFWDFAKPPPQVTAQLNARDYDRIVVVNLCVKYNACTLIVADLDQSSVSDSGKTPCTLQTTGFGSTYSGVFGSSDEDVKFEKPIQEYFEYAIQNTGLLTDLLLPDDETKDYDFRNKRESYAKSTVVAMERLASESSFSVAKLTDNKEFENGKELVYQALIQGSMPTKDVKNTPRYPGKIFIQELAKAITKYELARSSRPAANLLTFSAFDPPYHLIES